MTSEVESPLRVRCSDRLTVAESAWRQLRVPVRPHSTAYLRAIAGSGMECSFRYFLAERSDGQVVAAAYGFVMRIPLMRYLALPLFVTGSPVNLGVPFHFRCPEVVGTALPELVSAIVAEANAMGAKCLVVRDLWSPEPDQTYGPVLSALGLRRTPLFTDAVLRVSQDLETYLASLPSRTCKALRRDERRVRNAGYHFAVVRDRLPEPLLVDMQRLWRNLYDKYRDRDQVHLPVGYFQAVTALPESIALLAFHGPQLVGFDLLLERGEVLESTYSGIDGDHVGGRPVHRYMGHQIVRLAIETGFREVDFGTSNEVAKAKMGCRIRQGWAYVLPLSRVFGALHIDRLLFANRKGFDHDTERSPV